MRELMPDVAMSDEFVTSDRRAAVNAALARLPKRQRAIVVPR
jgi:DNA-directed RNA polymerase specialized sigma24 family protein